MMWLEWLIKGFVLCFVLLTGFAYLSLFERRILARFQVRVGPNRAGPQGLLQPVADGVKLIFKEELTPAKVYKTVFFLSPIIAVTPSLIIAAVIPLGTSILLFGREITLYVANVNVGVLYLTSIASIAVYGVALAGWSSNNKYAMISGLRASAQMVSYELALGLCFVMAIILGNSMSLVDIVNAQAGWWFIAVQPVGALIFWIAGLAELNRAPFDMTEAEQEISTGYFVEYSGMKFALFFMAEYQKMIVICMIAATFFFGGYRGPLVDQYPALGPLYLAIKSVLLLFVMIWMRATWPRIRYDRLMAFGWKILLPLSLVVVFITATGILLAQEWNSSVIYYVGVPLFSILALLVAVAFIYRDLRRKSNGRI